MANIPERKYWPPSWEPPSRDALGIYSLAGLLERERKSRRKLSLFDIFSSSHAKIHKTLATQSAELVQNEKQAEKRQTIDPRITTMALAIRTLDRGMKDLPIDLRFAFLFQLIRTDETMKFVSWFGTTEDLVMDCNTRITHNKERFERFVGYFEEMKQLYQTRPNILLATRGNKYVDKTSGMFTEYDYYIEHAIRENLTRLPRKTVKEIALSVPQELQSNLDPFLAYLDSMHKLRHRFGILTDIDITTEGRRVMIDSIRKHVVETEEGFTLTKPLKEIANELGIHKGTASYALSDIRRELRKEGKQFYIPQWEKGVLDETTVQLCHLVAQTITELDKPGHMWKYGQYEYTDLLDALNIKLEALPMDKQMRYGGIISPDMLRRVIERYGALHDVPRHSEKAITAAIKRDVQHLLQEGFSKNPEAIRDKLRLITDPSTKQKRAYWKKRVAQILNELDYEK